MFDRALEIGSLLMDGEEPSDRSKVEIYNLA